MPLARASLIASYPSSESGLYPNRAGEQCGCIAPVPYDQLMFAPLGMLPPQIVHVPLYFAIMCIAYSY